jgi:hypothetical protein
VAEGAAGDYFRLLLRAGMTGCQFAKKLAAMQGRMAVETHPAVPDAALLDRILDEHASANRSVIVVLPSIRDPASLVAVLNTLCTTSPRWRIRRRKVTSPAGDVCLGLEWTTYEGNVSDLMGFAPFPTMPIPRRAPYVAIAAWPGGRANPFRGAPPTPPGHGNQVSFLDAAHDFDADEYARRWARSVEVVSALMALPPDDARLYRRTAFIVDAESSATLS